MKSLLLKIYLLFFLTSFSAFSQQKTNQDSLLNHMVGNWVLFGIIDGKETTHDIFIEWVLGHQYLQLKEVSREKDPNGKPSYEAVVFITWDKTLNQYSCLWLDNTGNGGLSAQAIGHAKQGGDVIEFIFKISDSSFFQTTFAYDKVPDTWRWLMDGEENGKSQSFARVKLTRKK